MAELILSPISSKTCTKCGELKTLDCFSLQREGKFGVTSRCKPCTRKYSADHYFANKSPKILSLAEEYHKDLASNGVARCKACEKEKEFQHFYLRVDGLPRHYKCRECVRLDKANDRLLNIEKYKEKDRLRWIAQRDQRAASNKNYQIKNKEILAVKQKAWVAKNYESKNRKDVERNALRKLKDPIYAMRRRIKDLIAIKIRNGGYTKKSRTQEILGCDWDFFKTHIERQFVRGMTWENRSAWHLDHVIPMATAQTEQDILALNHFTNLRPMWAKDNLVKGRQITHLI